MYNSLMTVYQTSTMGEQSQGISHQKNLLSSLCVAMENFIFPVCYSIQQLESNEYCVYNYKATQMWSFAVYLPLMIGDKVPEEDQMWECFLLLLEITKYCTARVTSLAASHYVCALVDQHHREFRRCYPLQSFTPKKSLYGPFSKTYAKVSNSILLIS